MAPNTLAFAYGLDAKLFTEQKKMKSLHRAWGLTSTVSQKEKKEEIKNEWLQMQSQFWRTNSNAEKNFDINSKQI